MGREIVVNTGDRYNRLVIIEEVEPQVYPGGRKGRKMLCKCDCGNYTRVCFIKVLGSKINKEL